MSNLDIKKFAEYLTRDRRTLEMFRYLVTNSFIRVVKYHNTAPADAARFERELSAYAKCFCPVTADALNRFYEKGVNKAELMTFITLVNPFAPHLTEEMNSLMGGKTLLAHTPFPKYDEALTVDESINVGVQVNGKVRSVVELPFDCDEETAKNIAFADEKIKKFLEGKNVVKTIVVKNKIINIVVK